MDTVTKIDENSIKVIKQDTITSEANYSLEFLLKQKETIEAQKASEIKQRDAEIAEVDALIVECNKLGIKV